MFVNKGVGKICSCGEEPAREQSQRRGLEPAAPSKPWARCTGSGDPGTRSRHTRRCESPWGGGRSLQDAELDLFAGNPEVFFLMLM